MTSAGLVRRVVELRARLQPPNTTGLILVSWFSCLLCTLPSDSESQPQIVNFALVCCKSCCASVRMRVCNGRKR
eukprot:5782063-Amphidinium_carterae.2